MSEIPIENSRSAETQKSGSEEELSAFKHVHLARHQDRPYTLDFIEHIFEEFVEVHGDRRFADDPAVICGFARFHGLPVVVIGHQKGRDTKQRQYRNFGMPKPEGYRKALRLFQHAEKFRLPVLTLIATSYGVAPPASKRRRLLDQFAVLVDAVARHVAGYVGTAGDQLGRRIARFGHVEQRTRFRIALAKQ